MRALQELAYPLSRVNDYERHALERYEEYLDLQSENLERERPWLSISEEEEQFIEWRFDNPPVLPKSELPAHLKAARETIGRSFPTPAAVLWEISNADLKRTMIRLYQEHGYLCAYAHSGFRKFLAGYAEVHLSLTPEQKQKVVNTEYAQSILLSYLAVGFACAEAAAKKLARGREGVSGNRTVASAELLTELARTEEQSDDTCYLSA